MIEIIIGMVNLFNNFSDTLRQYTAIAGQSEKDCLFLYFFHFICQKWLRYSVEVKDISLISHP